MHPSNDLDNDNYDNDDLISLQLNSKAINLYFSQLIKYSKHVRDLYLTSDFIDHFSKEMHQFQDQLHLSPDSIVYFFHLLEQNNNVKENANLTYIQCIDLLKISKCLEVRKLTNQINEYIKNRSVDVDFVIQMIQYENKTQNENLNEIEISNDIENLLTNKINECLSNEKFSELPISKIYRIVEQSYSKNGIKSDKLIDFIKKSISQFCVLFRFVDVEQLSEDRLIDLCELYSTSNENTVKYFSYMKCNLNVISKMIGQKKNLQQRLDQSENLKRNKVKELEDQISQLKNQLKTSDIEKKQINHQFQEQQNKMNELSAQINQFQKQLEISEQSNKQLEKEKSEINKQLEISEKEKKLIQKQLDEILKIDGNIYASVKRELLINAQIKLSMKGRSLDSSKSKYIISTSDMKELGSEAYEKGEPMTSLEMNTIDFLCKSGTYYVRCLVFDNEGRSAEIVSNPVTTNSANTSFRFDGKPTSFSLLKGRYKLEVWGAKGGDSTGKRCNSSPVLGGLGGYSSGILSLDENETVYVFIGGSGMTSNSTDGSTTSGGFPDGGDTKTGHISGHTTVPGTGGGSTSIRIGGCTDFSRVIVAGGGGGASGDSDCYNHGGFGGGLKGGNSYENSIMRDKGCGTQSGSSKLTGNKYNGDPGSFGHGASGKYKSGCNSGGGGGGGWYGGGSGGHGNVTNCASGGGGSGWTFTESSFNTWQSGDPSNASKFLLNSSYYLTDALSVPGNENFPRPDGNGNEQGHSGNGYAKITPQY